MKRLFDILFAVIALIIFSIPIVIISFLIKISSPGPVLFFSKRVGVDNKIFLMPKFRTMYLGTPDVATDKLISPLNHITFIGKLLRFTSLDELPQFYSIIIGDMSVVGPRPALYNQFNLISLRTKYGINSLKPGLTGLAQISGRDNLTIKEKVRFDQIYLENNNMLHDLKIIFLTFIKILNFKNISH